MALSAAEKQRRYRAKRKGGALSLETRVKLLEQRLTALEDQLAQPKPPATPDLAALRERIAVVEHRTGEASVRNTEHPGSTPSPILPYGEWSSA